MWLLTYSIFAVYQIIIVENLNMMRQESSYKLVRLMKTTKTASSKLYLQGKTNY